MFTPKLGGWRKDEESIKDLKFDDLKFKLSANADYVDLRRMCSPIEKQLQLSSCVANAVVGGLELLLRERSGDNTDLSRLFIYYNSRLMNGEQDKDEGTYNHLAMGVLSSLGSCPEELCKYEVENVFTRPSWKAYRHAHVNRVDKYYRISSTGTARIQDIKIALTAHFPVVFGCIVDDEFVKTNSSGFVNMPIEPRTGTGGHAMLIVGFNQTHFIVRNSWGELWGDNGYCYIPFDYLDATNANDFWVMTGVK
jgi:C1A family cysteine protease